MFEGLEHLRFCCEIYKDQIAAGRAFLHEHPDGADKTPPILPTMQGVINLTVQCFVVYGRPWIFVTL